MAKNIEDLYNSLALRELLAMGSISTGTHVYRTEGVNSSLSYRPVVEILKDKGLVRRLSLEKKGPKDVREAYKLTSKGKELYELILGNFESYKK